ncbi:MAG: sulfatase-like hydrolase/transferase [Chloroflexota bacterium]
MSYIKPHWPYHVSAPYHNMFGAEHLLPRNAADSELLDPNAVYKAFTETRGAKHFARDEVRERVIPAYMGMIKQIDDHIGRLFSWLDDRNQLEDTVIVFTSDHGDYLGDHWLSEKDFFHEEAIRVPLIVCDPSPEADSTRGTDESRFIELVDLAATFLDIAGGDPQPHKLEGHSLRPLLNGEEPEVWRNYVISEVGYSGREVRQILDIPSELCRGYMIRDTRWKYIIWEGYPPQLFDLENDPKEIKDLGRDPDYQSVRQHWNAALFTWFRRRKTNTANSREEIEFWTPDKEAGAGVFIGYWSENELK